ncbi:MAG: ligase-associated DNA damage response endonuclease PdeM [Bacteroidota bacterium]
MQRHIIHNQTFLLHPDKVLFWEETSMLLIADMHLGKGAHFRKEGIAVPVNIIQKELQKLEALVDLFQAERVVFLGDLFHSVYNPEWEFFGRWMNKRPELSFELIIGNHDILSRHQYEKFGVLIHESALDLHDILLTHEPMEAVPFGKYNLAGHLHPGVRLVGRGQQYVRLACFYFSEVQGLLPAFGAFTGLHVLQPKGADRVFVVAEGSVVEV